MKHQLNFGTNMQGLSLAVNLWVNDHITALAKHAAPSEFLSHIIMCAAPLCAKRPARLSCTTAQGLHS